MTTQLFSTLRTVSRFLPLVCAQNLGPQRLERTPEPKSITDDESNVLQYDQVMTTKLAIPYAIALQTIFRARTDTVGGTGCDLACGPGHFSLLLNRFLQLDHLTGIDLSEPMIKVARQNARGQEATNTEFLVADITRLEHMPDQAFSVTTCMDAAHHFNTLDQVRSVVNTMERITRLDGVVAVMDLVRLRTRALTERYVKIVGADYEAVGLEAFYQDFRHSMFAAWTQSEFRRIVPNGSSRTWFHLVPFGLPTLQILLALPSEVRKWQQRRTLPWSAESHPAPINMRHECDLVRFGMRAQQL